MKLDVDAHITRFRGWKYHVILITAWKIFLGFNIGFRENQDDKRREAEEE